jgi:hypothetical protein
VPRFQRVASVFDRPIRATLVVSARVPQENDDFAPVGHWKYVPLRDSFAAREGWSRPPEDQEFTLPRSQ